MFQYMEGGFWLGLHRLSLCQRFDRCFVSINVLLKRYSRFPVGKWILDSGAFSNISSYGNFLLSPQQYVEEINQWKWLTKTLVAAVTQDYMCEDFILKITGLTVYSHQKLTIGRYDAILKENPKVYIIPVLQGYTKEEYISHLQMYGSRISSDQWIGVGSVCKRNSTPEDVYIILDSILQKSPNLKLHGFGLKTTALEDRRIAERLYSSDSMAWSFSARINNRDANSYEEAKKFNDKINRIIEELISTK